MILKKKSGMDRVLPKIIGSGRVSGTRQSLVNRLPGYQVNRLTGQVNSLTDQVNRLTYQVNSTG